MYFLDGVYIMGSRFTLADVIIFPYIAYMVALSLDLEASNLTHLNNYYKTLKLRPSIANTFPKYWDGSQDTTVLKDIHKYFGKYWFIKQSVHKIDIYNLYICAKC